MRQPNFHGYHLRKWYLQVDDTLSTENGEAADGEPLRRIVVATVVHNPFAGRHVDDLRAFVEPSVHLGEEFARRVREHAAAGSVQSYGKGCIVGIDGDYEHGNALLTTVFANPVRDAVGGGKSWVPSTGKRGGPGTSLDIPLAHKDALYVRSHYDTITATFADAPNRDEVLIAFAFATRGRLHARLGGLRASDVVGDDGLH